MFFYNSHTYLWLSRHHINNIYDNTKSVKMSMLVACTRYSANPYPVQDETVPGTDLKLTCFRDIVKIILSFVLK